MSDIIRSAQQVLKVMDMECEFADAIRNRDPRAKLLEAMDHQNITRAAIAARIWRHEGRKVLALHPEIVREVSVATSDKIHPRNLRALPYLSPMVLFPDPPEFKSWMVGQGENARWYQHYSGPETTMRLVGFLTYSNLVVRDDQFVTETPIPGTSGWRHKQPKTSMYDAFESATSNTHDPDAISFGMLAVLEVLDAQGKYLDWEINTLSIPFDARELTLREIVDDLLTRFQWTSGKGGGKQARDWMRKLMSTIVGSLFYLCSTTLEAERVPRKLASRIQPGMRKPPDVYRVGWKMGAALTRFRKAQEHEPPETVHPGREQPPVHRRGHFRRFPHDPEGERGLIYISPYWTHVEKLGLEGTNVAHRVPKVGPPGDAKESMRAAAEMP